MESTQKTYEGSSTTTRTACVLGVAAVALVAGLKGYQKITEPNTKNIPMNVRTYDNPWIIANRAEDKYGHHQDRFSISDEADRIAQVYGDTLYPGQRIEVHVK